MTGLPPGFTLRPPTLDDAPAVAELVNLCDVYDGGEPDVDANMILTDWQSPTMDLARDAWLVFNEAGQLVAAAEVHRFEGDDDIEVDGCVHPDARGLGLGTALLALSESRARELLPLMPPDRAVTFSGGVNGLNTSGRQLFEDHGYAVVRHFYRMVIDLDGPPPAPELSEGVTIRTFIPGQDEHATHEADEDAFSEHWGSISLSHEEWRRRRIEQPNFDPSLWFLAVAGDEIVGINLCRYRVDNMAWIGSLGVRKAWRGKGVGKALLLHAFGEFYRRGDRRIGLGVDAQNATGATRLYESAGMHVALEYVVYRKQLRAAP